MAVRNAVLALSDIVLVRPIDKSRLSALADSLRMRSGLPEFCPVAEHRHSR